MHTLRLWCALALTVGALTGVVLWEERLPRPVPADAPATEFSASRTLPILHALTDSVGIRIPGSAESMRAREQLGARLSTLPGMEVLLQDTTGIRREGGTAVAYRARNVLARLPGRWGPDSGAVLLSAHYDSPAMSVGAADDALGVATLLEVARALSAGPRPARTVVFAFGDAEEQGLLGADAFMRHPWARDVRAFMNLEAAGNAGRSVLFQATPGSLELVRQHASQLPYPHGSVIGQDIFQGGLIPSGTDFEVYSGDSGLPGLDFALYRGGWAYHTALDQTDALDPGSIQQVGANALALTRSLANGDLEVGGNTPPPVYHDVPGYGMVSYPRAMARWMAIGASVLLLLAMLLVVGRGQLRGSTLMAATFAGVRGLLGALVAVLVTAALMTVVFRHAHAWYAHPWRGVMAYGAVALTALLLAQHRFASRAGAREESKDERALASWSAAFLILLIPLVGLTVVGAGSAYLFLWWTMGGAGSLVVLAIGERRNWVLAAAIGLLPGALVTIQASYLIVELFVPIAGRMPISFPFDFILATIVAGAVAIVATPFIALLQLGGRPGAAAVITGAAALLACICLLLTAPFTSSRPQRLELVHGGDGRAGWMTLRSLDALGAERAAVALQDALRPATPASEDSTSRAGWWYGRRRDIRLQAPPPPFRQPTLELVSEQAVGSGRILELRIHDAGAYTTTLRLDAGRTAVWDIPGASPLDGRVEPAGRTRFVARPDSGWRFRLHLDDSAPVTIRVEGRHAGTTPSMRDALRHLPAWTTVHTESRVRSIATF